MHLPPAKDALELIGSTPLIKINRLHGNEGATIYAKMEAHNPGGSVKDRIALSMVVDAEKKGQLKSGGTIIEATSGNTGVSLAMVGAAKGYKVVLVMPETAGEAHLALLAAYGAEVHLSPAEKGMQGAIEMAEQMAAKDPNFFMPQQFNNPANPEIHRRTTAREIIRAMADESIHAFVAAVGTGGTITGVGEVLKSRNPQVRVAAVEPIGSPVLSGGQPGPHKIKGIGAGFTPQVLNTSILDEVIAVNDDNAYQTAKQLSQEEGLLVGPSAGAACFAALQVARKMPRHYNVIVVFPDTGERHINREKALYV